MVILVYLFAISILNKISISPAPQRHSRILMNLSVYYLFNEKVLLKNSKTCRHCVLHNSIAFSYTSLLNDPVVWEVTILCSTLSKANTKVAFGSSKADGGVSTWSSPFWSRMQLPAATRNLRSIPASNRARQVAFIAHAMS